MDKNEEVYEACILRAQSGDEQPIYKLFTELTEFPTRGLFKKHPRNPDLWQWCGRVDDTIVLATGANVSPVIMEKGVSELPGVNGVLMFGNSRKRPALLIQGLDRAKESLWETIDRLNAAYYEDFRVPEVACYLCGRETAHVSIS
jgi:hypothetical protein